ncbi:unnamed protein product [Allacma fusca]|uniref:Uncharacterized protein n=1 Tax=Allacma fusca TaxID=39272 RepID=A0A8J2JRD6_9HEXA|nr:unnamed protein product [Allacma fusca]
MSLDYCVCSPCSSKVYGQLPKFLREKQYCPMSCPGLLPPEVPPLEPKCYRRNILGNLVYKFGPSGTCCPNCAILDRPVWCACTKIETCYKQPPGVCCGPLKYVK